MARIADATQRPLMAVNWRSVPTKNHHSRRGLPLTPLFQRGGLNNYTWINQFSGD